MNTLTINENGKERRFEIKLNSTIEQLNDWADLDIIKEITDQPTSEKCKYYKGTGEDPNSITDLSCIECNGCGEIYFDDYSQEQDKPKEQNFPIVFENERIKIWINNNHLEILDKDTMDDDTINVIQFYSKEDKGLLIKAIDKLKEMKK